MQMTRHDAERSALPGRQDGAGWPLAVDLRGVHKHFGSVQAVRGVALTIGSGEVMAFLGPNGAGKTSTIDMILGLSRPDAGAVEVYGMAPRQAVRKGLVSAVMQTGGLLKGLTVAETAQYTASLFAVSRPVGEVLERAGITAIAGRRVGKCSGGEQQRLRFARALIPDPELLILDELDLEPGRMARDFRGRRRLEPAPRHGQSVTRLMASWRRLVAGGYSAISRRAGSSWRRSPGSEVTTGWSARRAQMTT